MLILATLQLLKNYLITVRVVKNSFGRLKGRWQCLLERMDFSLTNVPSVVASFVTLHNICERFGDNCLDSWIEEREHMH